jgi:hypothetical protein
VLELLVSPLSQVREGGCWFLGPVALQWLRDLGQLGWLTGRRDLEAVFILLEFSSPSRKIFIGSHSLPLSGSPNWSFNKVYKQHPKNGITYDTGNNSGDDSGNNSGDDYEDHDASSETITHDLSLYLHIFTDQLFQCINFHLL